MAFFWQLATAFVVPRGPHRHCSRVCGAVADIPAVRVGRIHPVLGMVLTWMLLR